MATETAGNGHCLDKSTWPAGPWHDEPDRVEFVHAGLPCLLLRGPMGAWCGYAAVLPGHPWHGRGYHDCLAPGAPEHEQNEDDWHDCEQRPDWMVKVHGGLTYSGACQGEICHVPKAGEPDAAWWFGFDCSHAFDFSPGMAASMARGRLTERETYRDAAYVREQVERLAEQLVEAGRP